MTRNAEKIPGGAGLPGGEIASRAGLGAAGFATADIPPVTPLLGSVVIWAPGEPGHVHARMGDIPPVLSGGYGGWNEAARPRKAAMTAWDGSSPFRLAVTLRIGEHRRLRSVEADCRRLDRLATKQGRSEPPLVAIHGPGLPLTAKAITDWVIEALDWGDATYNANGARTMADVAVTLMQHVWPGDIEVLPASRRVDCAKARSRVKLVTVRQGDTIQRIAARHLGSAACWKRIERRNRAGRYVPVRDPRSVKAGDRLRLP